MNINEVNLEAFPVRHLSYSAIRQYLTDRQTFFKRYIRLEFNNETSPSMLQGDIFHRTIDAFYRSKKQPTEFGWEAEATAIAGQVFSEEIRDEERVNDIAERMRIWCDRNGVRMEAGTDVRETVEDEAQLREWEQLRVEMGEQDNLRAVKWGKTSSPETVIANILRAVGFYRDAFPFPTGETVSSEERFISEFEDLEGNAMPIPLKVITDRIMKNDAGEFFIVDDKLVSKFSDQEGPYAPYEIQAAACFFGIRKAFAINPAYMIFRETKVSLNTCAFTKDELKGILSAIGVQFDPKALREELLQQAKASGAIPNEPQVRDHLIRFDDGMLRRFLELYKRIVLELSGAPLIDPETGTMRFLPNPFAPFGAEESWKDFCEEVDGEKEWKTEELLKTVSGTDIDVDDIAPLDL